MTIDCVVHSSMIMERCEWFNELTPGNLALGHGGPDHFVAHKPGAHCDPAPPVFGDSGSNETRSAPETTRLLAQNWASA